jgi:hypothetical protein
MKVSGFTFIRNAVKYDFPVVEAIKSILPVCNDVYVAVGNSEDNTLELIQSIDKQKIKIIETIWDNSPEINSGARVFALETDKAFQAIPVESDWAFYIQGDEVIHEKYLENIYSSMERYQNEKQVDGLLFNYLHFYGSYDYIGISPKWYRNEIRIIKNDKTIYSFRDAQGFRKGDNLKLNVKPADAFVYHYGWVKEPGIMLEKMRNSRTNYYKIDMPKNIASNKSYDYSSIDALSLFTETQPQVMKERIERKNWHFEYDISFNRLSLKYRTKIFLKKYLGINTYYENFKRI